LFEVTGVQTCALPISCRAEGNDRRDCSKYVLHFVTSSLLLTGG
jgi:hypothetical protein